MRLFRIIHAMSVAGLMCLISGCGGSGDPVVPKAKEKGPAELKPIGIQAPDQKKDEGGGPKIVTD